MLPHYISLESAILCRNMLNRSHFRLNTSPQVEQCWGSVSQYGMLITWCGHDSGCHAWCAYYSQIQYVMIDDSYVSSSGLSVYITFTVL